MERSTGGGHSRLPAVSASEVVASEHLRQKRRRQARTDYLLWRCEADGADCLVRPSVVAVVKQSGDVRKGLQDRVVSVHARRTTRSHGVGAVRAVVRRPALSRRGLVAPRRLLLFARSSRCTPVPRLSVGVAAPRGRCAVDRRAPHRHGNPPGVIPRRSGDWPLGCRSGVRGAST